MIIVAESDAGYNAILRSSVNKIAKTLLFILSITVTILGYRVST